jgi:hypothetical protein
MQTLYGTFPIVLPGVTESVSSYGLKKISGKIVFPTGGSGGSGGSGASYADLILAFGEAFPEPQICTTVSGLTEITFDAYSDTGAGSGVFGADVVNLSKSFSHTAMVASGNNPPAPVTYNWTITEIWIADSYTDRKVLTSSASSISLQIAPHALTQKMLNRTITGAMPFSGYFTNQLAVTWSNVVSSITRRNFGVFDEADIVSSAVATIA